MCGEHITRVQYIKRKASLISCCSDNKALAERNLQLFVFALAVLLISDVIFMMRLILKKHLIL